MSTTAKVLQPGETRFVVRTRKTGRNTTYEVYDRAHASLPVVTAELGKVAQGHTTEVSAQTEADRLNQEHPS